MKEVILKAALENAVKYGGRANINTVIGKVFSQNPKLKSEKAIFKKIEEIVRKVNSLSLEQQEKEFKKLVPRQIKKKTKEKVLEDLPNAKKGRVIMRFAPSPSGPMHIGHAYGISLSSEYCKKYNGKLILRIEDTNPENIDSNAYKLLVEDAKWITKNNVKQVIIQSDRLETYYDYAEKLVEMEKAYVCTCSGDKFRDLVSDKKACPCRDLGKKEQMLRFDKMFNEYKPGEAVLRIKTDLQNKNPAMRDFPLMRINDHKHPRQGSKYKVWPLMNFSVFVDDVESKMTHIIRAKDHMDNAKRQEYLYKYFNKAVPVNLFVGRINFKDLRISCSKTRVLIEENKYSGWDDIRLPFLLALRRRGYQPEAFIKYALEVGITQTDKTVTKEEFFKAINAFNKEIIEAKANRYFFIANPKKIKIEYAPKLTAKLDLHPDYPKRGKRIFKTGNEFYVEDELKQNTIYRFMNLFNFQNNKFLSKELNKNLNAKLIHWLPVSKDLVNVEILMPDGSVIKGLAEKEVKRLKVDDIIQFERFCFCRLDKKNKDKLVFWYAHR